MRRVQFRMSFIKLLKKLLKFLFAMSPNKKDVISISKPDPIGLGFWPSKIPVSTLFINMQAYGGAYFAPITESDSCCLTFLLDSNDYSLKEIPAF